MWTMKEKVKKLLLSVIISALEIISNIEVRQQMDAINTVTDNFQTEIGKNNHEFMKKLKLFLLYLRL